MAAALLVSSGWGPGVLFRQPPSVLPLTPAARGMLVLFGELCSEEHGPAREHELYVVETSTCASSDFPHDIIPSVSCVRP